MEDLRSNLHKCAEQKPHRVYLRGVRLEKQLAQLRRAEGVRRRTLALMQRKQLAQVRRAEVRCQNQTV